MTAEHDAVARRSIQGPERLSLTAQVTRDLQAQIDGKLLQPGDQLPTERALMVQYGVSRTVIREAVSSLRASGRLATHQGRGAFVLAPAAAPLTPYRIDASEVVPVAQAVKLMEVRIALEAEAAALAAQRRTAAQLRDLAAIAASFDASIETPEHSAEHDRAFHLCIAGMSDNPYFANVLSGLSPSLLPRDRLDLFKAGHQAKVEYVRTLQAEHRQILDAITRGSQDDARAAMRLHLTNSRERLRAALAGLGEKR